MKHMYEKNYELRGHKLIFYMPKEVDHHVAQSLCKELDMLIEAFSLRELELDFTQTEFMDSSGIGVLIGRSKTMQYRGGKIKASHLSRRVAMVFQSVGLQKIVEVKEDMK
ncbi:MAG: STAS domain-containing protein [Agathobacter sp.]|nr:STAS domain-containing protein [Agathobacter sp.]